MITNSHKHLAGKSDKLTVICQIYYQFLLSLLSMIFELILETHFNYVIQYFRNLNQFLKKFQNDFTKVQWILQKLFYLLKNFCYIFGLCVSTLFQKSSLGSEFKPQPPCVCYTGIHKGKIGQVNMINTKLCTTNYVL